MFGIGGTELVLILIFAFLIIGPDKLPKAGRTIGRAIRQFRNAQNEVNRVIKTEVYDPLADNKPLKNPAEILTGKKPPSRTVEVASPQSTETFAERRARLSRERAEREAAQAASAEAASKPKTVSQIEVPEGKTLADMLYTAPAAAAPAAAEPEPKAPADDGKEAGEEA